MTPLGACGSSASLLVQPSLNVEVADRREVLGPFYVRPVDDGPASTAVLVRPGFFAGVEL